MDLRGWEERYRSLGLEFADSPSAANPLLVQTALRLKPGKALDLASGTGRNALWLAEHGWSVNAIDGSAGAIEILRASARKRDLWVESQVSDLNHSEFLLHTEAFDLVVICFYLQRNLFPVVKASVKPGGILLAIVHITEGDEAPTESRLRPGELTAYFGDWEIVHTCEGASRDPAHKRAAAEIVARKSTAREQIIDSVSCEECRS